MQFYLIIFQHMENFPLALPNLVSNNIIEDKSFKYFGFVMNDTFPTIDEFFYVFEGETDVFVHAAHVGINVGIVFFVDDILCGGIFVFIGEEIRERVEYFSEVWRSMESMSESYFFVFVGLGSETFFGGGFELIADLPKLFGC